MFGAGRHRRCPREQGVAMQIDDPVLVSVDDHRVERPDRFDGQLAPRDHDIGQSGMRR